MTPQAMLDRRDAFSDADVEPAPAQVIERTHFLDEPERMVEWQQRHERAESNTFRTLRCRREKDHRRWRRIERYEVVLRLVITSEPSRVRVLEHSQPFVVQRAEILSAPLQVIEDAELHRIPPTVRRTILRCALDYYDFTFGSPRARARRSAEAPPGVRRPISAEAVRSA